MNTWIRDPAQRWRAMRSSGPNTWFQTVLAISTISNGDTYEAQWEGNPALGLAVARGSHNSLKGRVGFFGSFFAFGSEDSDAVSQTVE